MEKCYYRSLWKEGLCSINLKYKNLISFVYKKKSNQELLSKKTALLCSIILKDKRLENNGNERFINSIKKMCVFLKNASVICIC